MEKGPDCRVKITVTGRVQGVGFRYSTAKVAGSLGLAGFAKNLPDGTVYIEAEGSPDSVGIFVEWCKSGPPRAWVNAVECTYDEVTGYRNFTIF